MSARFLYRPQSARPSGRATSAGFDRDARASARPTTPRRPGTKHWSEEDEGLKGVFGTDGAWLGVMPAKTTEGGGRQSADVEATLAQNIATPPERPRSAAMIHRHNAGGGAGFRRLLGRPGSASLRGEGGGQPQDIFRSVLATGGISGDCDDGGVLHAGAAAGGGHHFYPGYFHHPVSVPNFRRAPGRDHLSSVVEDDASEVPLPQPPRHHLDLSTVAGAGGTLHASAQTTSKPSPRVPNTVLSGRPASFLATAAATEHDHHRRSSSSRPLPDADASSKGMENVPEVFRRVAAEMDHDGGVGHRSMHRGPSVNDATGAGSGDHHTRFAFAMERMTSRSTHKFRLQVRPDDDSRVGAASGAWSSRAMGGKRGLGAGLNGDVTAATGGAAAASASAVASEANMARRYRMLQSRIQRREKGLKTSAAPAGSSSSGGAHQNDTFKLLSAEGDDTLAGGRLNALDPSHHAASGGPNMERTTGRTGASHANEYFAALRRTQQQQQEDAKKAAAIAKQHKQQERLQQQQQQQQGSTGIASSSAPNSVRMFEPQPPSTTSGGSAIAKPILSTEKSPLCAVDYHHDKVNFMHGGGPRRTKLTHRSDLDALGGGCCVSADRLTRAAATLGRHMPTVNIERMSLGGRAYVREASGNATSQITVRWHLIEPHVSTPRLGERPSRSPPRE